MVRWIRPSFIWMCHINATYCDMCKSNKCFFLLFTQMDMVQRFRCPLSECFISILFVVMCANPMKNSLFLLFTRMRMVRWSVSRLSACVISILLLLVQIQWKTLCFFYLHECAWFSESLRPLSARSPAYILSAQLTIHPPSALSSASPWEWQLFSQWSFQFRFFVKKNLSTLVLPFIADRYLLCWPCEPLGLQWICKARCLRIR